MFARLQDIPAAIQFMESTGVKIETQHNLINGRTMYCLTYPDNTWELTTDYGLLELARNY